MESILKHIKRNLILYIIISTLLGLINGSIFNTTTLKSLIPITLLMMVFPMFLKVQFKDLLDIMKKPKPIILSFLLNVTLIPIYGYFLGKTFFASNPELMFGILILALIPTGGMTPTWTGFASGDIKSSILMMTVNLLSAIILVPLYLNIFLGATVAISNALIVSSLLKTVLLPLILANFVRFLIEKYKGKTYIADQKHILSGISSLGLISLIFIAISMKSNTILGDLTLSLSLFIPLILFYTVNAFISHIISVKFLGRKEGIAFVYSILLRNLTIALAVTVSISSDSMAVLLIALANIVQHPIAALYLKFANSKKVSNRYVVAIEK